uniref:Uncharacterized protein n=1 Tax=Cannabis sativa TaxID=3483 RepID=A0A803Q6A0_CANSA
MVEFEFTSKRIPLEGNRRTRRAMEKRTTTPSTNSESKEVRVVEATHLQGMRTRLRVHCSYTLATRDHTPATRDHTPATGDHTPTAKDHTPATGDHLTPDKGTERKATSCTYDVKLESDTLSP